MSGGAAGRAGAGDRPEGPANSGSGSPAGIADNRPRAVLSWSSGKDCAHALHVCRRDGLARIEALMTTVNGDAGRVAMHGTRIALLRAQAEAVGLPLIEIPLPWPCSNEDYGRIMGEACAKLVADGFSEIVFGDLFLEDIRAYREAQLEGSGLTPRFPLFGRDTRDLAREMLASGLAARVVTCDPSRVSPELAGRAWDAGLIAELPDGIDPCGENGEFHTVVTDGPEFARPLAHALGERVERDGFVYRDVLPDPA